MTDFDQAVSDYLAIRRALGLKLERHGKLLPRFAGFVASQGATYLTNDHALAWAMESADADPIVWANRLVIVRGFAKYLASLDPRTEVPPLGLITHRPHRNYRAEPYIYSDVDVVALLEAAGKLNPFQALTYQTMIALLSCTGCRIGEALRLETRHIDFVHSILVVLDSKFGKSREVPLHETALEALSAYLRRRDQLLPAASAPTLFLSTKGTRLTYKCVQPIFARLVAAAGLKPRSARCRPRLHDFRHTVAVRQLLEWHRCGADVNALLPLLSTMLGHVDPSSTYWYLSAVPELLASAASRAQTSANILP